MKQDKRLTRGQKIILARMGLDPKRYRLLQDLPNSLVVRDMETGRTEIIEKG